jgi:glycosyltransferase involved in cell wall biosynthesis
MRQTKRIAFIGNSLPRRCGIATFTTDLQQAIAAAPQGIATSIVAMTDRDGHYAYPDAVGFEVRDDNLADYIAAAQYINEGAFDAVSLQHEFGIFGGEAGAHVLTLLERIRVPIVTTLHTILAEPSAAQRRVLDRIVSLSSGIVTMSEMGRDLLLSRYGVDATKVVVIPHGIPAFDFVEPDEAKARLGFAGRTVILTFGLLSPNKGIEVMIDALPAVLAARQDVVYVVLGATHPNLVRNEGESYRQSLVAHATALGIGARVVFLDQFVDRPTLLEHIAMCDVYVTPYLNEAQMTSGTLAYSFGLGKAVVSTPYWHATELLAGNLGILVPFGDADATGAAIVALLTDEPRRQVMRRRAFDASRPMVWSTVAEQYIDALEAMGASHPPSPAAEVLRLASRIDRNLPAIALDHLSAMTDDTGLFQHAIHAVPDRAHGYCVDDNARGLLLTTVLGRLRDAVASERLTSTFAAFVQHAWNEDTKRFRNFMGFDRRWLEPQGSEDSHGRTLWALGAAARIDRNSDRRKWAASLFGRALPVVESFRSPRAWAFTLLGLDDYCEAVPGDEAAPRSRNELADRLLALIRQVETTVWVWFEEGQAYDNARFCEAMIRTGIATGNLVLVAAGIRSLEWLTAKQTGPAGTFRPIGSDGFQDVRTNPRPFDQQPVEAAATIAACRAAFLVTGETKWRTIADQAFAWFLGANDLSLPLVDVETGSCRDGLHPDRANENRGGESVVSYLLSLADMRLLESTNDVHLLTQSLRSAQQTLPSLLHRFRGRLVANHVPKPASPLPPS